MQTFVIFAKAPEPHQVKTRLGKDIGYGLAARVANALLLDTLALLLPFREGGARLVLQVVGEHEVFNVARDLGYEVQPQKGKGLGDRLENAARMAFDGGASSLVFVGSDSPMLPIEHLQGIESRLRAHDVAIGPSEDGGYCWIASKKFHPQLFEEIPWSTGLVLERTLEQARALGLSVDIGPTWYDIDTIDDLKRLEIHAGENLCHDGPHQVQHTLKVIREIEF